MAGPFGVGQQFLGPRDPGAAAIESGVGRLPRCPGTDLGDEADPASDPVGIPTHFVGPSGSVSPTGWVER